MWYQKPASAGTGIKVQQECMAADRVLAILCAQRKGVIPGLCWNTFLAAASSNQVASPCRCWARSQLGLCAVGCGRLASAADACSHSVA